MKKRQALAIAFSLLLVPVGCSDQTADKAREAGEATGEAIESAAEDTAENVDEAAKTIDERIDGNEDEAAEDETP